MFNAWTRSPLAPFPHTDGEAPLWPLFATLDGDRTFLRLSDRWTTHGAAVIVAFGCALGLRPPSPAPLTVHGGSGGCQCVLFV